MRSYSSVTGVAWQWVPLARASPIAELAKDASTVVYLTLKAPISSTGDYLLGFYVSSYEMALSLLSPMYTGFEILVHVVPVGGTVMPVDALAVATSAVWTLAPCLLLPLVAVFSLRKFGRKVAK